MQSPPTTSLLLPLAAAAAPVPLADVLPPGTTFRASVAQFAANAATEDRFFVRTLAVGKAMPSSSDSHDCACAGAEQLPHAVLVGVADGHGGADVAEFVERRLPDVVQAILSVSPPPPPAELCAAISAAFASLDGEWLAQLAAARPCAAGSCVTISQPVTMSAGACVALALVVRLPIAGTAELSAKAPADGSWWLITASVGDCGVLLASRDSGAAAVAIATAAAGRSAVGSVASLSAASSATSPIVEHDDVVAAIVAAEGSHGRARSASGGVEGFRMELASLGAQRLVQRSASSGSQAPARPQPLTSPSSKRPRCLDSAATQLASTPAESAVTMQAALLWPLRAEAAAMNSPLPPASPPPLPPVPPQLAALAAAEVEVAASAAAAALDRAIGGAPTSPLVATSPTDVAVAPLASSALSLLSGVRCMLLTPEHKAYMPRELLGIVLRAGTVRGLQFGGARLPVAVRRVWTAGLQAAAFTLATGRCSTCPALACESDESENEDNASSCARLVAAAPLRDVLLAAPLRPAAAERADVAAAKRVWQTLVFAPLSALDDVRAADKSASLAAAALSLPFAGANFALTGGTPVAPLDAVDATAVQPPAARRLLGCVYSASLQSARALGDLQGKPAAFTGAAPPSAAAATATVAAPRTTSSAVASAPAAATPAPTSQDFSKKSCLEVGSPISARPTVRARRLTSADRFLVLGSDGLVDHVTFKALAAVVAAAASRPGGTSNLDVFEAAADSSMPRLVQKARTVSCATSAATAPGVKKTVAEAAAAVAAAAAMTSPEQLFSGGAAAAAVGFALACSMAVAQDGDRRVQLRAAVRDAGETARIAPPRSRAVRDLSALERLWKPAAAAVAASATSTSIAAGPSTLGASAAGAAACFSMPALSADSCDAPSSSPGASQQPPPLRALPPTSLAELFALGARTNVCSSGDLSAAFRRQYVDDVTAVVLILPSALFFEPNELPLPPPPPALPSPPPSSRPTSGGRRARQTPRIDVHATATASHTAVVMPAPAATAHSADAAADAAASAAMPALRAAPTRIFGSGRFVRAMKAAPLVSAGASAAAATAPLFLGRRVQAAYKTA